MGSSGGPRSFRFIATWAAMVLVAFACGVNNGQNQSGLAKDQVYRVNINTEPKVLDPTLTQYTYEAAVDRQLFGPLVTAKFDSNGNPTDVQPAAAERCAVSSDGLTWTFHLRKNNWSEGQPVRGRDFVTAWKRMLDPTLAAPYADPFFDFTVAGAKDYANLDPKKDAAKIPAFLDGLGLKAPDDNTFVVTLQQPAPYFKWIASLLVAAPVRKDVIDKYGSDKWGAVDPSAVKSLVSNGPFMMSELVPQDHISAVPNPHWTGKKPTLSKITLYEIADDNQALARYRTGELDDANVPLSDTQAIQNDARLGKQVLKTNTLVSFWVGFNLRQKPFDNPKVRQAFTQAV